MTPSSHENPIVGIDLGTTSSRVGVWQDDRVQIIPNSKGSYSIPSYVAFTDTCPLIGDAAKAQMTQNPHNTIFGINVLIGRKFSDPEVQQSVRNLPFKVVCGQEDTVEIEVTFRGGTKTFTPVEVVALLLVELREMAEKYTGKTVEKAVMTVQASFNRFQRQALKDAGAVAGLNVLRFISSGTAASIAYGFDKKLDDGEHNVLVFDLGGGALNVSLVCIELDIYEVKASAADVTLGGQVFDNLLVEYCVNEFERAHGNGIRTDSRAMARLRLACEHAKKALSFSMEAFIELDALHDEHSFYKIITRATLESLCGALFEKALQLVQNTLRDGTVKKEKMFEVVVVGGSARIPKILQLLKDFLVDKAPSSQNLSDDSAAVGVTAQAAVLNGTPSPKLEDFMLLDVVPLSFWAEIDGVGASTVVYRNSTLPMKRTTNFSTSEDNQSVMHIRIFEGESYVMSNNHLLGTVEVDNIPLKPRGEAEVAVAVDVDAGGVVNVAVTEKSTGLEKKLSLDWGGFAIVRNGAHA